MSEEKMSIYVTTETLENNGYPSAQEMVRMLNQDLLPFFEEYFPTGMHEMQVIELAEVSYPDFIFVRADGTKLAVWESYFKNPEQWKSHRLATRKVK